MWWSNNRGLSKMREWSGDPIKRFQPWLDYAHPVGSFSQWNSDRQWNSNLQVISLKTHWKWIWQRIHHPKQWVSWKLRWGGLDKLSCFPQIRTWNLKPSCRFQQTGEMGGLPWLLLVWNFLVLGLLRWPWNWESGKETKYQNLWYWRASPKQFKSQIIQHRIPTERWGTPK